MTSFHVVVVLSMIISALAVTVYACIGSVKRYKAENEELRIEIGKAAWRVEHMKQYMAKNKSIGEEADEKRRELNETADGGLVGRANTLFGVRDKSGGGNGAA